MKPRVLVNGHVATASDGEVSVEQVEPGVWSVLHAGQSIEVCLDGELAWVNGRSYEIRLEDPRELPEVSASAGPQGRRLLKAPMPGRVVRVLVAEGEAVIAGQGILVVEAMKMQNELPSPKPGVVAALHVKAGDAVTAGTVLAEVE